ncbi:FMI1 protein [Rhexocercosporidium sp. MPI-PUGE-AT-0058]|nr:FMI1 protein [Rhexocercosporidium sp. MPI-PUGE-AT-0058]
MFLRPLARSPWCIHRLPNPLPLSMYATRTISTRPINNISKSTPPFPTIQTCPSPSCTCAPMPAMPEGLPIDHSKSLNGTMAPYAEQVLICTGKDDWESKIEDENSGDNLAADIKELMGRGGVFSDPYHNVSIINTSFPSSPSPRPEIQSTSAYLVPSFKYIPFLPRVSFDSVQALVKGHLLPTKLHPAHDNLSPIHKDRLLRSEDQGRLLYGVRDVRDILVLVCGHGGRDMRCGVLGPVLRGEFERQLEGADVQILKWPVSINDENNRSLLGNEERQDVAKKVSARVGLISHIGGHKFAGNVILYIPPGTKTADGKLNELAGCGIWYGRVEPRHVEGIVRETVLGGRVIEDLFRGGIRQGGEILRL